jgi:hypothetical protein
VLKNLLSKLRQKSVSIETEKTKEKDQKKENDL